ncbi:serine hydrolase [Micromonospora musae]|uniref:Serine hydrolase n=1 Tax=Micromonospora musae TaxID=1894970 RepID=A0A3A9YKW2_9ACTN|nr:serine hydrolase [Micromonospora musae]RKN18718.1 serine hydrolase [Micromonospora musae]RKN34527.1 serine hydrolase [Micromonospora musae]
MTWEHLDAHLDTVPGTVSAYVGRPDAEPAWTRRADATHYAASTMKAAVLAALHRAAEAGALDLDAPVPVVNSFDSAQPGAPRFTCAQHYDNDDAVWARVGGTAPLRWLAHRMIVRSSNLATNLVIGHVGLPAVAEVWSLAGARHSVTGRGIEDFAARDNGITNLVTAADLAALLGALATGATRPGPIASPAACAEMLDVLVAQEHREDLAAGLPPGTRIAHKNGWVRGVRHGAGVVFPDDAAPYAVVVCTTRDAEGDDEDDADACALIADVSARVWSARHDL